MLITMLSSFELCFFFQFFVIPEMHSIFSSTVNWSSVIHVAFNMENIKACLLVENYAN